MFPLNLNFRISNGGRSLRKRMVSEKTLSIILYFLLFHGYSVFAQQVTVNYLPDTSSTSEYKKVVQLWENYLSSKPDSVYNNPYWNSKEKSQY